MPATLNVSLNALAQNYTIFQARAPHATIAAVVKADCYGLGMAGIIPTLYARGCRHFFVAYPEEGATLRELLHGELATIYVLCDFSPQTILLYTTFSLTPTLNSLAHIALWQQHRATFSSAILPLLQVETGMNRCGLPAVDWQGAAKIIDFPLSYIMSHLACADEPHHPHNEQQRIAFEKAGALFPHVQKSLAASWGVMLGAPYHHQMIRLGTGLYGAMPHQDIANITTLTAPILEVRHVDKGNTVGYGAAFISDKKRRVATIAIGYADGYPRELSNKGVMYLEQYTVPVIGRVSMDVITVDVTDIPETIAAVGGNVTVYGNIYTINNAAADAHTIGYEILTRLSQRVKRLYV